MASQGQGPSQPQGQMQSGGKGDLAPVLQQLNMTSLRTRTQDLHNAIGRILHAFHTTPALKWSEVLGQFAMVNVELMNLIDDVKPILKMFVVYPKTVNAGNAPILPIMLSSKLLPEMEAEEATMKEKILAGISNLALPAQTDYLQRQIEAVRLACDMAEKVITDSRKVYGLGTRQGPVSLATLDKINVSRIAEQEKLLRAATNFGEGLRLQADQQHQPSAFPPHLASVLGAPGDGRLYFGSDAGFVKAPAPVLPPSGLLRSGAPQQSSVPQISARVQTPNQPIGAVGTAGVAASPSPSPYVNSPRSNPTNFNVPSPQQHQQQQQQQQQQSQVAYLQKARAQHQLQRHQQQQQQQHQIQAHVQQQQQQLRRPATPPIHQTQIGGQGQAQVSQPLLHQQQQKIQHLQQNHLQQLQQQQHQVQQQQAQAAQLHQLQAQQDRQALQHLQAQQQQNLQQQLQTSQLQTPQSMITSNTLQQGNQVRPQIGQLGSSMTSLYGGGTNTLLTSNLFQQGNMSSNHLSANQPQRNVSSQMLTDSLYLGVNNTATQMAQGSSSLGLPLQQQLVSQPNYMNMFNNASQSNFGQNRQPPPTQ